MLELGGMMPVVEVERPGVTVGSAEGTVVASVLLLSVPVLEEALGKGRDVSGTSGSDEVLGSDNVTEEKEGLIGGRLVVSTDVWIIDEVSTGGGVDVEIPAPLVFEGGTKVDEKLRGIVPSIVLDPAPPEVVVTSELE